MEHGLRRGRLRTRGPVAEPAHRHGPGVAHADRCDGDGRQLLDPVLAEIAAAPDPPQNAQYWIEKTAHRSEAVIETVLERLVRHNILEHDRGGFWLLIARHFNISVVPPDYEIGFNPFPTAAPNRKLKFRIDERRTGF